MGKRRQSEIKRSGRPPAPGAASKRKAAAPTKTALLTWRQLREYLREHGFGDVGEFAFKEWREATPPIPIAKQAARRGDANYFDGAAVAAWLKARRANAKPWQPSDQSGAGGAHDNSSAELRKVRALRERLRYEREAGDLVNRRELVLQLQKTFNEIMRRGFRTWGHIAPLLAATNEVDAVRSILDDEWRRLCMELARGGEDLIAAEDEGGGE